MLSTLAAQSEQLCAPPEPAADVNVEPPWLDLTCRRMVCEWRGRTINQPSISVSCNLLAEIEPAVAMSSLFRLSKGGGRPYMTALITVVVP